MAGCGSSAVAACQWQVGPGPPGSDCNSSAVTAEDPSPNILQVLVWNADYVKMSSFDDRKDQLKIRATNQF